MKVIIVDDHSLFRNGLAHLFKSQPDFEVIGEAGTIKEALSIVEEKHPELVLMDLGLPDGSGIDVISRFLQIKPDLNIVFLTIHDSEENAFTAIRHGAKGFLMKDIPAAALLSTLRGLKRGELAVSRAVLSRFVNELLLFNTSYSGDRTNRDVTLTFREIEVMGELANDYSNTEIAHHLSISENTTKVHVHNILHKLKLQSRQEAAAYARRFGLKNSSLDQQQNQKT